MALITLGINHNSAPIDVREKIVFAPESIGESLTSIRQIDGIEEAALLSTCNRTEMMCWHNNPAVNDTLPEWLSQQHSFELGALNKHLYSFQDAEAIRHTMRVACGLDSMVLGEPQILGQLKSAYRQAQQHGSLGKHLNRLFQYCFSTAKKVRTETAIGASPVSIAFAAVSLAKQLFTDMNQQTALLIGAGETIELAAHHLAAKNIGRMIVANRTVEKAQRLAEQFEATAIALPDLPEYLPQADIVISSTASPLPIVGKGIVERSLKIRKHKPVLMLDIAVPRDIEAEVSTLNDVYLYTVDDLQDVIRENMKSRQHAAEQAEELVINGVNSFMGWLQAQDSQDTINSMRTRAEEQRDELLQKCSRMLTQGKDPQEVTQYLANTLTNKLLHAPTISLSQASRSGDSELISAAHQIFDLPEINK